jgi:hypothetical protein
MTRRQTPAQASTRQLVLLYGVAMLLLFKLLTGCGGSQNTDAESAQSPLTVAAWTDSLQAYEAWGAEHVKRLETHRKNSLLDSMVAEMSREIPEVVLAQAATSEDILTRYERLTDRYGQLHSDYSMAVSALMAQITQSRASLEGQNPEDEYANAANAQIQLQGAKAKVEATADGLRTWTQDYRALITEIKLKHSPS